MWSSRRITASRRRISKFWSGKSSTSAGSCRATAPVVQFHWGGGTPTYLTPEQMEQLFVYTAERFTFAPDAEIGIEIDPRVTTPAHLETLRRLGFNRLSMGIQDFHPEVQEAIHRIQPLEMTRDLIEVRASSALTASTWT